jgi:hypothetical protein
MPKLRLLFPFPVCHGDLGLMVTPQVQRAWVAYRDRHCDLVAENWGGGGGQAQPMIHAGCLKSESDLRTDTLRAYVIRHEQRPYRD